MPGLGDLIDLAEVVENVTGIDVPGVGQSTPTASSTTGNANKGPIRGARLEYDVPELGGRLLIKEPFGFWLGLEPVYPEYGTFANGDNQGKSFTKRAGFRFRSFQILLKPGTKIKVPKATAAKQRTGETGTVERQIGNFFIGVSDAVTVKEFIEFLKANKQANNINGIISPTLRKYQWGGVLHRVKAEATAPKP